MTEPEQLRERIAAFLPENFASGSITEDLTECSDGISYPAPPVRPVRGQRPRVLMNRGDLAGIWRAMENNENACAVAEYRELLDRRCDGILPEPTEQKAGLHNFDFRVLASIQAMAMDYRLTGNLENGLRAVLGIKNFLLTLNIVSIASDQCRQYGNTMYVAACVYDWCYELLTPDDRRQIVLGVEYRVCRGENRKGARMEVGFPPTRQGAVSGHGGERQLLRDYLAFAIAIYDEYPLWWEFIAGRYYAEFVPVRECFYKAWMYPQGVSNYVRTRFVADLWSAWLIRAIGAPSPFTVENMREVMRTVFCYEVEGGYAFNTGDSGSATFQFPSNYGTCALIASYLFDDPVMRAQVWHLGHGLKFFSYVNSFVTPTESLILSSSGVKTADDRHEGFPLIRYNGGWLGQIIAHRSWDAPKSPSVLMKIGVRSTANHDHQDAGQFQIFYRSCLAGDSGSYAGYGSDLHKYYHQATLAHNSLLIFNPMKRDDPEYKGYYSGGQRKLRESGSFEAWQAAVYDTGTVTGMEYAYRDDERRIPDYAYIAGDITASYDPETVSRVERRMLTVFPEDTTVPMLFTVFDTVVARDPAFRKTFLFHPVTEPVIDGCRITEVNGEGKLVLQTLLGADSVVALGGEDRNYLVNGVQIPNPNRHHDGFWGRVEISPAVGRLRDRFLHVFYVCDAGTDPALTAEMISADAVSGTGIGNYVFLFAEEERDNYSVLIPGNGTKRVFLSGLPAGNWTVSGEGAEPVLVAVTAEGRLLTSDIPAGKFLFRRIG